MAAKCLDWQDVFTTEQQDRLRASLEAAPERDRLLIMTLMLTGARGAEIVGNNNGVPGIRQSDLKHDSIYVTGAKRSNSRYVQVPVALVKELRKYCLAHNIGGNDRIFPVSTRHLRRIWDEYRPSQEVISVRKNGVAVHKGIHKLRHTYLTMLYDNSKRNVDVVMKQSGLKERPNVDIYVHFVEGKSAVRQAIKGMWKRKLGPEGKEE
jgi:integrase